VGDRGELENMIWEEIEEEWPWLEEARKHVRFELSAKDRKRIREGIEQAVELSLDDDDSRTTCNEHKREVQARLEERCVVGEAMDVWWEKYGDDREIGEQEQAMLIDWTISEGRMPLERTHVNQFKQEACVWKYCEEAEIDDESRRRVRGLMDIERTKPRPHDNLPQRLCARVARYSEAVPHSAGSFTSVRSSVTRIGIPNTLASPFQPSPSHLPLEERH
jgi:hypothetical protein